MKFLIALTFAFTSTVSVAAGDAEAGKAKSAVCAACHGPNGVAIAPIYPNLAGQKEAYLMAQLQAFKSGERKGANSALMAPMTAALSDEDMANLAAYYAGLDAAK